MSLRKIGENLTSQQHFWKRLTSCRKRVKGKSRHDAKLTKEEKKIGVEKKTVKRVSKGKEKKRCHEMKMFTREKKQEKKN